MIKQIELFDSVIAEHNLKVAQEHYDQAVPLAWGEPQLDEPQLRILDYLNHQKDRWEFIQAQEKALSDLIADGYSVIACYSMGDGMRGCHMVLYKADDSVERELSDIEHRQRQAFFGLRSRP